MTSERGLVVAGMVSRLSEVWASIEAVANREGVLRIGASNVEEAHAFVFEQWLDRGHDATMAYLRKNRQARMNPLERFQWARSVIVMTVPYPSTRSWYGVEPHIARYALGDDYHQVLDRILRAIENELERLAPAVQTRRYVDTGPLSDRAYAAQAGLGWIGKNSMLIDPEHGSFVFIGTLLTSLQNDIGAEQVADRCGSCTRCIDACPTGAILSDRTVASEHCISYATIEHRGPIAESLKAHLAGNIFGCDICNEVCPWNEAPAPGLAPFESRSEYRATPVSDLLRMTRADFSRLFRNSAIKRAKRAGLLRNAILVADEISPVMDEKLSMEDDEGIRDALRWRRKTAASG